jgi:hypothetical protein
MTRSRRRPGECGALMTELLVALSLLIFTLLPLTYSFVQEKRLAVACYQRAVAIELVDGEMEALLAGEWRAFTPGTHQYQVRAGAAANLPPGQFRLTVRTGAIRLEWLPAIDRHGGPVVREAKVK